MSTQSADGTTMAIEFQCLNCRNALVADDCDAGEKTECDQCGIRITIPKPIGGELTDKRLRATTKPPPLSIRIPSKPTSEQTEVDLSTTATSEQPDACRPIVPKYADQRYFDLNNQPPRGFDFTVSFPEESIGKLEFETLVRSAAQIRESLITHLDQETQYFERGALVMAINRWRGDHAGYDVNIRLVGLINDIEVSHYFYSHRDGGANWARTNFGMFGVLMARGIDYLRWTLWRELAMKRFHRQIITKVVIELMMHLDETVGRPVSAWRRFARYVSG